ncbi:MAG: serine/threonine-protein kinase [Planctomycetota bacterium]|nr:serine/threonine-protein kinase [Planctomycetota bacterium]MDA1165510.1 serine/threonine-protein kinase [Planctomycetota bacterium]
MKCPSNSKLAAFLDGTLEDSSIAEIAAHINGCQKCQTQLDDIITCDSSNELKIQSLHPTLALDSHDQTVIAELVQRLQSAVNPIPNSSDVNSTPRRFAAAAIRECGLPISLDHYRLLEKIGEGATGELYRATDERLGREVAVKVLKPELAAITTARARFEREARACASLRHDHIIAVHHVEAGIENQCPYLVMEFVRGGSLLEHFDKGPATNVRANVEWLRQAAEALQAAHDSGIVHRDIKPSNLLIDETSDRLLVVDFGLARLTDSEQSLTAANAIAGTPAYMSPEQITHPHDVTGLSDVYSLGVVLYETLTGERPFRGTVRMVLNQVQHEEPVHPRRLNDRIPRDLETICLKAMSKEQRLRYKSAAAFADDLQRWLDGRPVLARPVGPIGKIWRWTCRNPRMVGVSTIVVSVLMAGAVDWGRYQESSTLGQFRREWKDDVLLRDELIGQNVTRANLAEVRWLQSIRLVALTVAEHRSETDCTTALIPVEARALLKTLTEDLLRQQVTSSAIIVGAQSLGDIWSQLNDDDFAYRSYQIAAEGTVELLEQVSPDPDTTRILIRSHCRLGEIDLAAGRLESADDALQIALSANEDFERRSRTEPPLATSMILRLLGETAEQSDDLALARRHYTKAIAQLDSTSNPENSASKIDTETALTFLGYASLLNRLNDPQAHPVCVSLCDLCCRQSDQSLAGYRRLAAAYGELAKCCERLEKSENEIMTVLSQQAEVLEQITQASEADISDRRNSGKAWLRLASRHARLQDWSQSGATAQKSINVFNGMVESSGASPADQLNLAEAELLAVTIQMQDGSVTDIGRVENVGRSLNEVSRLFTVDEAAELKPRISLLMQQCQRLIESASASE